MLAVFCCEVDQNYAMVRVDTPTEIDLNHLHFGASVHLRVNTMYCNVESNKANEDLDRCSIYCINKENL